MKAVVFVIVASLLVPPLASLARPAYLPLTQESCATESALLQQEAADLNTAIAEFNTDCGGQISPQEYAKKGCAARAKKLSEWSDAYNRKLEAHNTRCGK